MNHDEVEPILQPWMERQTRSAPDGLLLRVMTEVGTMSQESLTWRSRIHTSSTLGWITGGVAVLATALAVGIFIANLPSGPAGTFGSPSPAASVVEDTTDSMRDIELEAVLPHLGAGEAMQTWSISRKGLDVAGWVAGIADRTGKALQGYAVASTGSPARDAWADRYGQNDWNGSDDPLRIHVLAFANAQPADLYAGFEASYLAALEQRDAPADEPECAPRRIASHDGLWCSYNGWGRWDNWWAFADGSRLYVVEGVGERPAGISYISRVVESLPWNATPSNSAPGEDVGDPMRDAGLEALLPDSLNSACPWLEITCNGEPLQKWSLSADAVALGTWLADIGVQAEVQPLSYAVAHEAGTSPARSAGDARYEYAGWDAGKNHDVRIHAVAFQIAAPEVLLDAFEASYRAEVVVDPGPAAECKAVPSSWVGGRGMRWCYVPTWGEWQNWYGYAHESTLFLIEGVGDIEGMETSGVSMTWLQEIVAALPEQD